MSAIGVDTGGTTTRFWDGSGEVLRLPTPTAYGEYVGLLARQLGTVPSLASVVVAVPATIRDGRLVAAGNIDDSWLGPPLADDLRARLPDGVRVELAQDTEAAGYAVRVHDCADARSAMVITLSTGVGGAWIDPDFVRGLEVGHMPLDVSGHDVPCGCGQRGCVEVDLSGTGVRRHTGRAAEELDDDDFWRTYGTWVGRFVATLTPAFVLDHVVLMGGVCARSGSFLDSARATVREQLRYLPVPRLTVSTLADDIGVIGAYEHASRATP